MSARNEPGIGAWYEAKQREAELDLVGRCAAQARLAQFLGKASGWSVRSKPRATWATEMRVSIEYEALHALCVAAGRAQGALEALATQLAARPDIPRSAIEHIRSDVAKLAAALAAASKVEPL